MTALVGGALGAREMASCAVQVQAVAEIVQRLYEDTLLVVQMFLVALIQATVQLTFLPLAVLRIEISQKLFSYTVYNPLPGASSTLLQQMQRFRSDESRRGRLMNLWV